jgi:GMP synthase-like glutamine amidotransferase
MKIGILQAGHSPDGMEAEHGDYGEMFAAILGARGFDSQTWSVVDNDFPTDPADADGWLITGSRHGAYDDLPFIPPLEDFIRRVWDANVPMIGVCFGHQIIAQALGGKVEKFAGGWSVGATDYALKDGSGVLRLNAWHQDQVTVRPAQATVLASSPFCENAILAYGDRALTIQPHPEFTASFIKGLIDTRGRGKVPDALLDAADANLGRATDNDRLANQMADFFRQPRG